jgi:hypothetical protein
MNIDQKAFLKSVGVQNESEAIKNSVIAAFQRNRVYKGKTFISLIDRKKLQCALRSEMRGLASSYSQVVSEDVHCGNIQNLAEKLTEQFREILDDNRFKIGTAQKALNLYLKFLWCLGVHQQEPPHCPLDGIILKKAKIYEAWTKLDSMDSYRQWVGSIRALAQPQSLSEWELKYWKR